MASQMGGAHIPGLGLGVDEDGLGAHVQNGVGGTAEGEALTEDVVAGLYIQ